MVEHATAPAIGGDRADREVDAAGGDDERHAERDEQRRRAVAQDVDEAAEQVPVLHRTEKKRGVRHGIRDDEQHEQPRRARTAGSPSRAMRL